MKPRIGILSKTYGNRFGANLAYLRFWEDLVPPTSIELVNSLSDKVRTDINVLVLIGGPDICAGSAVPSVSTGIHDPRLEWFDSNMLPQYWEMAEEGKLSILGICRGLQAVNKFLGGEIDQDFPYAYSGDTRWKEVEELNIHNTDLFNGKIPKKFEVNSLHHQGIYTQQLSDALEVVATSKPHGNVEIAINKEGDVPFFLGCQYHPEELLYHEHSVPLIVNWLRTNGLEINP